MIKNGYSKDYFEPFYECKLCNDTGFVTDENFKTSMCSCLKQKLLNISFNKSNMYNLKKKILKILMIHFFLMKLIYQNISLIFHLEKHSKYKKQVN